MTRITAGGFRHQALFDVRRSLARAAVLQRQIASGLRVTRPSDDPAAAARILPLQSQLRALGRMADNARLARESLDLAAQALQSTSERVLRAREIALQAANGTASGTDRRTLANEIDQLLEELVGLGNTRSGDSYLFGGTSSRTAPFALVTDAGGTRIVYHGGERSRDVAVGPGITATVALAGSDVFLAHERGTTLYAGTTGAGPGAPFDTGTGFDTLEVTSAGVSIPPATTGLAPGDPDATTALGVLSYTFTAPDMLSIGGGPPTQVTGGVQAFPVGNDGEQISLDVTLPISPATGTITSEAWLSIDGGQSRTRVDFASDRVIVEDAFDGSLLHVDVTGLARTGTERLEYPGTFDVFTALIAVRDALRNTEGLPDDEVQGRLNGLLDDVEAAHDRVLLALQGVGARSESLLRLDGRLADLQATDEAALSRLRDTDMVAAILQFEQESANYQAALQVTSRAVQLSLLTFLG